MFLVPLAFAADDYAPPFEYARPSGSAEPALVTFSRWAPEQTLYVAEPADLVAAPEGAPSARLDAGTPVTIVAMGTVATVGGMTNAWYEVRTGTLRGWIFGARLTPYAFGPADAGGPPAVTTVSFTPDHQIRVRTGDQTLDLPTAGGGYLGQDGAGVTAELVPAARVGVPLLHLHTGVEACADFAEYWVVVGPRGPVLAHQDGGLIDPPNCFSFEPTYKPGKLVLTYTENGCADDGSKPKKRRKVLRLVGGRFVE